MSSDEGLISPVIEASVVKRTECPRLDALYNVIAPRHEKRSTIITTNLAFPAPLHVGMVALHLERHAALFESPEDADDSAGLHADVARESRLRPRLPRPG